MKFLRRKLSQTFVERSFVASLALLCAIVTILQYYWTGELSRAARERLGSGLAEQIQSVSEDFDTELLDSCAALVPRGVELTGSNRPTVHAELFRRWRDGRHRPIFGRLAVAVPDGMSLKLFLLDQKSALLTPAAWPPEWAALRGNLQQRLTGGGMPFKDTGGLLREAPVFGRGGGGPESEQEWMIFEIDSGYLRQIWLPELIRTYLNPGKEPLYDVTVKTVAAPQTTQYATTDGHPEGGKKPASVRFNRQIRYGEDGGDGELNFWTLTVWPRSGAFEAAVFAARWRNLALACIPSLLILTAAVALVRYTRRSRKLAETQMNFVANVSHELRTPLTVIRGAGHNLLRGIVRERRQVEQYLRLIIQHADQLTGMIEELLELADARKKAATVRNHEPVAIGELLDAAIAATLTETRDAGCEIQATILRNLPLVNGDATALRRVFQNLLTNAAKYGAIGGWIGVETACLHEGSRTWVEVRVLDRGPGIPEHEQKGIFEPFFRGSGAQNQQIRGTGLGLSLVREIVQAHGGVVSVQSKPWKRTSFVVRLPAAEPRKASARLLKDGKK